MRQLTVYLRDQPVGTLVQSDGGTLEYRYLEEWLSRRDAIPLSRSLPLSGETYRANQARPFFAGILPDEAPRRQIASVLGISERNDFALLERIGGECAGAVSLLPDGVDARTSLESGVRELDETELATIVSELPRRPLLAGSAGVRLSLAGSQGKLPVLLRGTTVALPLGSTPSTHIIKPEPDRFPGLVANEVICMTLARSVGLRVPSVATRRIGDTPCLIVERYDREPGANGAVDRIHQEDFCQALGIPPERKYQAEGGPLARDCIGLLRDWSSAPAPDIRDFLDALIFTVLIGNADAHGKNYSLLYRGGERRLAPLYDLVCTLAYPDLSTTPAMKIGGSTSIAAVTPEHFRRLAVETGLGWPMVRERIAKLCSAISASLDDPAITQATDGDEALERVRAIIVLQIDLLAG